MNRFIGWLRNPFTAFAFTWIVFVALFPLFRLIQGFWISDLPTVLIDGFFVALFTALLTLLQNRQRNG